MIFNFPSKKNISILALGAESAGNFSVFKYGKIHFSEDFGDLLEEKNWQKFKSAVLQYLRINKIKPEIILTDLHPMLKTTFWGKELVKKFGAKFVQVQHHHAHIFSAIGDKIINSKSHKLQSKSYCIAMDGTGFGTDEKIWGGEAFAISNFQPASPAGGFPISNKNSKIKRIGHLENQIMLGGEMAIQEPARMLIGILYKLSCHPELVSGSKNKSETLKQARYDKEKKDFIYFFVKKYYSKNEFELLWNQLKQNFNCIETSSTGRILDAVSVLLGFCKNEREYKHQPTDLLEKNSTIPYSNLKPKIEISKNNYILNTTYLFEYLIKNIKKDKKQLAATAQFYIAEGLWQIIEKQHLALSKGEMSEGQRGFGIFLAGGLANNKIISKYFISQSAYASEVIPRGDAGISFGQIIYYLLEN